MAAALQRSTLGPYLVGDSIGVGGMGIIYRAQHRVTLQQVALKRVRLPSPELLASFRREIHALARMRHPGIVRIIDHGVTENTPWYAMELIAGQTLAQILSGRVPEVSGVRETAADSGEWMYRAVTEADALDVTPRLEPSSARDFSLGDCLRTVRAICRTLSFLHGHGWVHRDLKPANILIRADGSPVLVDFGLVMQFAGAAGREVSELAEIAGTFPYMAPEQRFGRFVDARADLFSLGCVLYEWLTGKLPFGAAGITATSSSPPPPSLFNQQVSPELDALVTRLTAKDPRDRLGYADDVESALEQIEGTVEPEIKRRSVYLYRSALAGRDEVLPRLEDALVGALNGEFKLVLVTGESGGGKTRLVMELAARAADRRMRVLTGECVPIAAGAERPGGLGAPFQPFKQFLHTVVDACAADAELKSRLLMAERAAVLAPYDPLFAALVEQVDSTPLVLPLPAARARLFDCLRGLLVDYAREQPLLLVLDDLQWADELSREFLASLAEAKPSGAWPFVIVGTCRVEEMDERLRALAARPGVAQEQLTRFDHAAVKDMVGGMLALADPPQSLVDFVTQESRGNPFFIAEYLRAAIEAGLLHRDAAGRWHLSVTAEPTELRERVTEPPTISALVALRLRDLDQAALDILRAAAVLGREFDVELVARTADLEPTAVLDTYAALRPRNILEEDGSGVSRFAHDKLREMAYAETSPEERATLHRRAASALEDRYASLDESPHFGELGFHFAQAGAHERAAPYYQRAGQQAQTAYANEDALRFLNLALSEVERVADPDPALASLRLRLLEQIGDCLLVVGRPTDSRAVFDAGLGALGATANAAEPHERARWRRKLAQTWERQHRHLEALTEYALAEAELGATPDAPSGPKWWDEFVQIQVDKAWSLYFLARVDELTALVERVRPAVVAHASPIQLTKFLEWQVLGAAKRERMHISDKTLEDSRALLEAGEACGEAKGVANARFMRGFVLLMRGLDEQAEPYFKTAIEDAERMGDALLRTRFISYYAIVLRRLGRLAEAQSTAETLLAFANERAMLDYVGVARANLAWCAWRTQRYDDAERYANEALAAWDTLRPTYIYPLQWLARLPAAAALHRAGKTKEAIEHCERILQDPQQRLAPALESAIQQALERFDASSCAAIVDEATRLRYL